MAKAKRKGGPSRTADYRPGKRAKDGGGQQSDESSVVKHALLAHYYTEIKTLREYALAKLPSSSRIRRKKIASVDVASRQRPENAVLSERDATVGSILDSTLVACRTAHGADADAKTRAIVDAEANDGVGNAPDLRWKQWLGFSQKGDESYVTLSDGLKSSMYSQSEIVDFVVWLLFSREKRGSRPKHLLCDGFRRCTQTNAAGADAIPGLSVAHPNERVKALKENPWPQLLMLLGKEGERIMIDLLVDCAVFTTVAAGRGNLYQLSGIPISDLESLAATPPKGFRSEAPATGKRAVELRPAEIVFLRSRMLYSRPALNARGIVHFGLNHTHMLNRYPSKPSPNSAPQTSETSETCAESDDKDLTRVMMYIFPRQFGLHNVFTSIVDRQQTAQPYHDYTHREDEIAKTLPEQDAADHRAGRHIPKRLRGPVPRLIQRLRVLHGRCAYAKLLEHYCPVPENIVDVEGELSKSSLAQKSKGRGKPEQATNALGRRYDSIFELATPVSSVSAFCQAVFSKIIPHELWAGDLDQEHNRGCFLKNVDSFIRLRRYETMCLHDFTQGMRITGITWLAPPGIGSQKCSQTDLRKRSEILQEFLFYLVDSLLIPLIRSNFYVTESSVHRCRLFFFRHDVWQHIAEPAIASLQVMMFEEVGYKDAQKMLASHPLGFAQVRLLPKQSTMRPIMNLRRRTTQQKENKKFLGPSINSMLEPMSKVLGLQKTRDPSRLGSAMFSVGDIYTRIKAFKARLGRSHPPLYLAKVDVQACFDTIPQDAVLKLLQSMPFQGEYITSKHVEVSPVAAVQSSTRTRQSTKRWHTTARLTNDTTSFRKRLETAPGTMTKENTVFIDGVWRQRHKTSSLLALTATHVEQNIVRMGKKYYRQKQGIPQGSVLSTALCSYFYADLERKHLDFLRDEDCLLLRLIDDFLLITTDQRKAARFVQTMHGGMPEYGVTVSLGKSLVNFEMEVDGAAVPRLEQGGFPYCGLAINCATLEVGKPRGTGKDPTVFNSLTVDFSRCPGQNFQRKVINAFRIQSHLVCFDTSHNSRQAALTNAYNAFVETATKMWAYARCLPKAKRPGCKLMADTMNSLVDVAYLLLAGKSRKARYPGYNCAVSKPEVAWLAMVACRQVLVRKQAGYGEMISWLEKETATLSGKKGVDCQQLVRVVKRANRWPWCIT